MGVPLTGEQEQIRAMAREVAERELAPRAADWEAAGTVDRGILEELGELGFLGLLVPEEFGGLALDLPTYVVVLEELARGDAGVALVVANHAGPVPLALSRYGSDEQRATWLPRLAAGASIAGTTAVGLEVSFEGVVGVSALDGGGPWELRGLERWVAYGGSADVLLAFGSTGPATTGSDGDDDVGAFLVEGPRALRGGNEGPRTMGLRSAAWADVDFDGVEAEPLGDPARGRECLVETVEVARVGAAAVALGIARAALEHGTSYALEREQFDRPIIEFGAVQEKLALMTARLEAARCLAHAWAARLSRRGKADEGGYACPGVEDTTTGVAIAKLVASEAAVFAADEAVQLFGGYGYMKDYPVEKLMRDSKGMEIYGGTAETLRPLIAEELTGDDPATRVT